MRFGTTDYRDCRGCAARPGRRPAGRSTPGGNGRPRCPHPADERRPRRVPSGASLRPLRVLRRSFDAHLGRRKGVRDAFRNYARRSRAGGSRSAEIRARRGPGAARFVVRRPTRTHLPRGLQPGGHPAQPGACQRHRAVEFQWPVGQPAGAGFAARILLDQHAIQAARHGRHGFLPARPCGHSARCARHGGRGGPQRICADSLFSSRHGSRHVSGGARRLLAWDDYGRRHRRAAILEQPASSRCARPGPPERGVSLAHSRQRAGRRAADFPGGPDCFRHRPVVLAGRATGRCRHGPGQPSAVCHRARPGSRRRPRPVRSTLQRIARRSLRLGNAGGHRGVGRPASAVLRTAGRFPGPGGGGSLGLFAGRLDAPLPARRRSWRPPGALCLFRGPSGYAARRARVSGAPEPRGTPGRCGSRGSAPRNRFATPSGLNLITAAGTPAFVEVFNTPLDARARICSFAGWFGDHLRMAPSLSLDLGALADSSHGSPVPSGAGSISWTSVSPRVGFAWRAPHTRGMVLRGAYFRVYSPLAGRYLDFANPNSLSGMVYQWTDRNGDGWFQAGEQGPLLWRFGGPWSSISPSLRRPYADEFNVGAEWAPAARSLLRLQLFRRDEKNRIAAADTGVPAQAFDPRSILDPGPDGIAGTFDDQMLTVYAQNPATLGQDRYLLDNPPGLRMLYTGLLAEAGVQWRRLNLHACFVAEKSYGATNPGDAVYENDPGVIGALLLDPNTSMHAAGRDFMDRAYVGKLQAVYAFPPSWGGMEIAAVADYLDGLVFARQLLVTGLPQGPFLAATTVRGSPEGGNRAQYALNWNLRLRREFRLPAGALSAAADILNVTNAAQRLQENDLSGPAFNLRLPVAIQPPRFVRLEVEYRF